MHILFFVEQVSVFMTRRTNNLHFVRINKILYQILSLYNNNKNSYQKIKDLKTVQYPNEALIATLARSVPKYDSVIRWSR